MCAQELKAKKLEMARLQIALQAAENRRNKALMADAERARRAREAEEFAAMKARMAHLERLVVAAATSAAALPVVSAAPGLPNPNPAGATPALVSRMLLLLFKSCAGRMPGGACRATVPYHL